MFGKVIIYTVGILSVSILGWFFVVGNEFSIPTSSAAQTPVSTTPVLTTDTWGIFDPNTGTILAGENLDKKLPIASVTKLFTADAVLGSQKKDETFTILASDVNTEGRAGKLVAGEKVTPYELLFPLLIESSNDAAEAIRRHLGEEFLQTIFTIKKTLSLTNTIISDASGLDSRNVSTVEDLSTFYAYLRKAHPHVLDITQLHTYVGSSAGYVNNDPARTLTHFTGGKHGYTDEAGRTFVGTFTLPNAPRELGFVLLKSDDLLNDIQVLLAYSESL